MCSDPITAANSNNAKTTFWGRFLKAITLKEAPYVLTLLVAALGWSVTHTVDRLTQMPIIEYKIHDPTKYGERVIKCEVTNICDKVFRDLNLYLTVAQGKMLIISTPEIGFVKPIMPDPFRSKAAYIQGHNAAYFVPELQPLCSVSLETRARGPGDVELRYYNGHEAIRLIEAGFQTWLVENEIEIMFGLIICWLLLLILFAFIAL
jgi:hypothetical protein